jgi:hypothetical protein
VQPATRGDHFDNIAWMKIPKNCPVENGSAAFENTGHKTADDV